MASSCEREEPQCKGKIPLENTLTKRPGVTARHDLRNVESYKRMKEQRHSVQEQSSTHSQKCDATSQPPPLSHTCIFAAPPTPPLSRPHSNDIVNGIPDPVSVISRCCNIRKSRFCYVYSHSTLQPVHMHFSTWWVHVRSQVDQRSRNINASAMSMLIRFYAVWLLPFTLL